MKRDITDYIVPLLFVIGIFVFFIFIPIELRNLTNFIGYMSSLSTVIMVIVYISTNSRQLITMNQQLSEMTFTRNVQYQPILSIETTRIKIDAPKYYSGPRSNFKKAHFFCRLFFDIEIQNIGNGPALSLIFLPKLKSIENKDLLETWGRRIDYISLKEGDKKVVPFLFFDEEHNICEHLLEKKSIKLDLIIVYKNSLGLPFKEKMIFNIYPNDVDGKENIKSCIKIIKTSDLDYGDRIKEHEKLRENEEESTILRDINKEITEKLGFEELVVSSHAIVGSFIFESSTEEEYNGILNRYNEELRKLNLP